MGAGTPREANRRFVGAGSTESCRKGSREVGRRSCNARLIFPSRSACLCRSRASRSLSEAISLLRLSIWLVVIQAIPPGSTRLPSLPRLSAPALVGFLPDASRTWQRLRRSCGRSPPRSCRRPRNPDAAPKAPDAPSGTDHFSRLPNGRGQSGEQTTTW